MTTELCCPKCESTNIELQDPEFTKIHNCSYITVHGDCLECKTEFYCDYELTSVSQYGI